MARRKRTAPDLRYRGSLESAGIWFENVAVVVDRAASQSHGAAAASIFVDESSAHVLARRTGQPAMLSFGPSMQMQVSLAADTVRPGQFAFQALLTPG